MDKSDSLSLFLEGFFSSFRFTLYGSEISIFYLMNSRFFLFLFSFCFLPVFVVYGNDISSWITLARENNADILQARAELQAAIARVPQAKSLPDPMIEFETMGTDTIGSGQSALFMQSFPWPGTLRQKGSKAAFEVRSAWHSVQTIELQVISRIRIIAAEIAYLQKERNFIQENLILFQKQEDFLAQTARTGGNISDLVRVEIESSLLEDELARSQEKIRREIAELEALTGSSISADSSFSIEKFSSVSASAKLSEQEALNAKLETHNPFLQSLSNRIDAARAGTAIARLETYPEFMIAAGYQRIKEMGHMAGGDEWMDEGMLMFSVSLPIWKEKNKGKQSESAALLEAALQEREAASRALRAQLTILLSRARDASRRIQLYQDRLLPKARQSHETLESAYKTNKSTLLDVFDSRRRLLETETGYWRAITDFHVNRAEIDSLFGSEIQLPEINSYK